MGFAQLIAAISKVRTLIATGEKLLTDPAVADELTQLKAAFSVAVEDGKISPSEALAIVSEMVDLVLDAAKALGNG